MMTESWKSVSDPYWHQGYVKIDYEMQDPDTTPYLPPNYPYRYFYIGEPFINGVSVSGGGGQMSAGGILSSYVLFDGDAGDTVTLKLAKIDRDNLETVDYPDEVTRTVPTPCIEGSQEILEVCPDGVTATLWRECIGGEWIYYSAECPDIPPPICDEGEIDVKEYCPDGVTPKQWWVCEDNEWVIYEEDCDVPPPSKMPLILATIAAGAVGIALFS
jgi:hypothetical protein